MNLNLKEILYSQLNGIEPAFAISHGRLHWRIGQVLNYVRELVIAAYPEQTRAKMEKLLLPLEFKMPEDRKEDLYTVDLQNALSLFGQLRGILQGNDFPNMTLLDVGPTSADSTPRKKELSAFSITVRLRSQDWKSRTEMQSIAARIYESMPDKPSNYDASDCELNIEYHDLAFSNRFEATKGSETIAQALKPLADQYELRLAIEIRPTESSNA